MRDETKSLITRAEEYMNKGKFNDAGKCFEEAAASVVDKREAVEFLKKAAQAYDEWGVTEDAVRCYLVLIRKPKFSPPPSMGEAVKKLVKAEFCTRIP